MSSFFLGSVLGWDGRNLDYLSDVLRPSSDGDAGLDTITSTAAVPARWHSKVADLASPTHKAVVRRIFLDYEFVNTTAGAGQNGWGGLARGRSREHVLAAQQVLSRSDGERHRAVFDVHGGFSEVQVRVERTGTDEGYGQIHDASIEFEPAQKRGNH